MTSIINFFKRPFSKSKNDKPKKKTGVKKHSSKRYEYHSYPKPNDEFKKTYIQKNDYVKGTTVSNCRNFM